MKRLAAAVLGLSVALAACEPVEPTFVDAATDANTTDGVPADAAEGTVTLNVVGDSGDPEPISYGTPRAGVAVHFVRPDGTVTSVTTGADGVAAATIVTGSVALVARQPDTRSLHLTAYTDLAPGMTITVGARPEPPPQTTGGTVTFTMPAVANAQYYTFVGSCVTGYSGGTGTFRVDFATGCPELASATVVMAAHDSRGQVMGYATRNGLNLPTLYGTTQALGAAVAPATAVASYTAVPAAVTEIENDTRFRTGGADLGYAYLRGTVTGGSLTLSQSIAAVGATTTIRSMFRPSGNLIDTFHIVRSPGQQLTSSLAVGTSIIPFSTRPSFDPVSRAAGWTLVGGAAGHAADAFYAHGNWSLPDQTYVDFRIIGAGTRTSVVLPPLPASLAAFVPPAGTTGDIYEFYLVDVVGADFATVVQTLTPEAPNFYFDRNVFPAATELWFGATLPL